MSDSLSLHPDALHKFGLFNYYLFFRVSSYCDFKDAINNADLACYGIFGFHDVLIQSYEEDMQFSKLRLQAVLGHLNPLEDRYHDSMKISSCIKYRNKVVSKWNDQTNRYEPDKLKIDGTKLQKYREQIRNMLLGEEVDATTANELKKLGVLVEGLGSSDLSPKEKNEDHLREFWVVVWVQPENDYVSDDYISIFEKDVLMNEKVLDDPRVRTIEVSEGGGSKQINRANYVLHIVGTL